jgi:hypothetical protein
MVVKFLTKLSLDALKKIYALRKALIELHFQHEALSRFIENVLRSTLSYPNETSKECIQFLIIVSFGEKHTTIFTACNTSNTCFLEMWLVKEENLLKVL